MIKTRLRCGLTLNDCGLCIIHMKMWRIPLDSFQCFDNITLIIKYCFYFRSLEIYWSRFLIKLSGLATRLSYKMKPHSQSNIHLSHTNSITMKLVRPKLFSTRNEMSNKSNAIWHPKSHESGSHAAHFVFRLLHFVFLKYTISIETQTMVICQYFLNNTCRFGTKCHNEHVNVKWVFVKRKWKKKQYTHHVTMTNNDVDAYIIYAIFIGWPWKLMQRAHSRETNGHFHAMDRFVINPAYPISLRISHSKKLGICVSLAPIYIITNYVAWLWVLKCAIQTLLFRLQSRV